MSTKEHFPANLPGWLENKWPLKNISPQIYLDGWRIIGLSRTIPHKSPLVGDQMSTKQWHFPFVYNLLNELTFILETLPIHDVSQCVLNSDWSKINTYLKFAFCCSQFESFPLQHQIRYVASNLLFYTTDFYTTN